MDLWMDLLFANLIGLMSVVIVLVSIIIITLAVMLTKNSGKA